MWVIGRKPGTGSAGENESLHDSRIVWRLALDIRCRRWAFPSKEGQHVLGAVAEQQYSVAADVLAEHRQRVGRDASIDR